jgi:hypothetical protein
MNNAGAPIPVGFEVNERGMAVIRIPREQLAAASDTHVLDWFRRAEAMIRAAKENGVHVLLLHL